MLSKRYRFLISNRDYGRRKALMPKTSLAQGGRVAGMTPGAARAMRPNQTELDLELAENVLG